MNKKGNKRRYTDEELLEILRNEFKNTKNLTCKHFTAKNGLPNWSVYRKRFGSFNNAKMLAGVEETINNRYDPVSKEEIINHFKEINKDSKYPMIANEFYQTVKYSHGTVNRLFGSYDELVRQCGYTPIKNGVKITKEFLLDEILRYISNEGKIPRGVDLEYKNNKGGYPNRKTYDNHFGGVTNALIELGIFSEDICERIINGDEKLSFSKLSDEDIEVLKNRGIKFLQDFYKEYNHVPTTRELDSKEFGGFTREYFRRLFGGYTKAVNLAGLTPNSIPQYDDNFLKLEFDRFVSENGRIPKLHEFNNSDYPSFWCYQARFGSWNKAVTNYGYEPNDANRKYYMDDGEVCMSSYEFDISNWLKSNNINYERNVPYTKIHNTYKGKMDCDYKIIHNGVIWYVEMAGFLSEGNKLSEVERVYFFKMKYKEKLLKESNVNYLIIRPRHLKKKTMDQIFNPIFENKLKEEY